VSLPSLRIFEGGLDRVFPSDAEGSSLCYRAADLCARWFLNHLTGQIYNEGNIKGAKVLFHAELYLQDRLAYELYREQVIHMSLRREAGQERG
jgi:hypothetical protein